MTKQEISLLMRQNLGQMLKLDPDDIEEDENFFNLGVSSVQALKIVNLMRRQVDVEINPVAMFEFKTIADITDYIYHEKTGA